MDREIDVSRERKKGIIGLTLMLLSPFFYLGIFLWIIGVILVSVSIKRIDKTFNVKDTFMFKNWLIGIILMSIGQYILAPSMYIAFKLLRMFDVYHFLTYDYFSVIVMFVIIMISYLIVATASIFLKRSMVMLYLYSRVKLFNVAGWLMILGGWTSIVGIGFLYMYITYILFTIAFFKMPVNYTWGERNG